MTNSKSKAWILDVGHGSSAVIEDTTHVAIVDGGRRDTLLRFLLERKITRIDKVIVSHADADHFGGILLLLSDKTFEVAEVFVNPDSRDTGLWNAFLAVMIDSKRRGTRFHLEITDINPGQIQLGETSLEIVSPTQELAYKTSTGHTSDGRSLSANSMSVVVRVSSSGSPRILLTGDLDQIGFDSIMASEGDLSAEVLVYPHHGGRSGSSDLHGFAEKITQAVDPNLVIFSIGRGLHRTPRPEVVAAVVSASQMVHIACTQLSEHCASELPEDNPGYLTAISEGVRRKSCCAGTISISLEGDGAHQPRPADHIEFVRRFAPTALCQLRSSPITANRT